MAAFDPVALERMQGIYRDVVSSLCQTNRRPTREDLERIAQDILRWVTAETSSREEIIAAICARALARSDDPALNKDNSGR